MNGGPTSGGGPARTEEAVVEVVRSIVGRICGIPLVELSSEQRIAHLDIDSVFAAEILVRIESELDIDIDVRQIVDDWSALTLRDLATQIGRDAQD